MPTKTFIIEQDGITIVYKQGIMDEYPSITVNGELVNYDEAEMKKGRWNFYAADNTYKISYSKSIWHFVCNQRLYRNGIDVESRETFEDDYSSRFCKMWGLIYLYFFVIPLIIHLFFLVISSNRRVVTIPASNPLPQGIPYQINFNVQGEGCSPPEYEVQDV
ncbi:hypothetical protein DFA_06817 [Cavenderia fasciculata]|uniref:Uncharacterized protein n=1 Tax=Cavenderia fasciculata TaxID=261658 RepID=F4Q2D0_CACFS|nr:uncharacterized protein DFA_06817 [Cavenderia fasciculata]EGG18150.1 hypothetical protein DFA_06817 [Cavenderia fasciculata]|eukprot:XP_004366191.1 hypothetical protein DFA_06817 [Cavenderia fasciculata]